MGESARDRYDRAYVEYERVRVTTTVTLARVARECQEKLDAAWAELGAARKQLAREAHDG